MLENNDYSVSISFSPLVNKERSKEIYLYLLEFTYAAKDRELVEMWLSQANLGGVLISTEQYDDQILAVLANEQALAEACEKLHWHPAVSSCVEKRRAVYRVVTTIAPERLLSSFPLREGEEWYLGTEKTAYLCMQSQHLSDEQISWLATSTDIAAWESLFDLTPITVGR